MASHAVRTQPGNYQPRRVLQGLRNPLYRSSYALVMNTAGTTIVGILYWAVAAHLYSRQELGRSSALISALILLSGFAQLNLVNTLPRFVPGAGRSAGRLIAYSYGVSSIGALLCGLAFVTVLPRLSTEWRFVGNSLPLALAFVIGVVVWGVFALQDAALLSLRHSAMVPLENLVYGVSKLLLLVIIALSLPSTGVFISWVIPLAITVPGVNWLIFRRYLKDNINFPSTDELRGGDIVRYASVDYVGAVLSQAYGNLLPLLVLSILGPAANGSFYIAWTIASGLGLVGANFSTGLLVEGSAAPHRLAELTRGMLARCVLITTAGAAVIIFGARLILGFYGAGYSSHAATLLILLALGAIPNSVVVVSFSLDRIAGRVGRAGWIRLALTLLVLGGSWILAKKFGINGVAFAWGGANAIVALARIPAIMKAIKRRHPSRRLVVMPNCSSDEVGFEVSVGPGYAGRHSRPAGGRHRAGLR